MEVRIGVVHTAKELSYETAASITLITESASASVSYESSLACLLYTSDAADE